jgi:hypothetical protein
MNNDIYLQYTSLGISVIPIAPGTKEPHFDRLKAVGWSDDKGKAIWNPASQEIASPEILEQWFGDGRSSIALVGGAVSNGLVYLDWDNALSYKRWAVAHQDAIKSTAVSRTASGYHVFFRLPTPESGRTLYYDGHACGQIRGERQYVVEAPSVHPSGVKYEWLHHPSLGIVELENLSEIDILLPPNDLPDEYEIVSVSISDQTLLVKARSAWWCTDKFQRLWAGNWIGYHSRSEAHLALCRILAYWTGRDPGRIDYLFRQSDLYKDQGDATHANMREKWHRISSAAGQTYGELTIDKACRSTTKVYEVRRPGGNKWKSI